MKLGKAGRSPELSEHAIGIRPEDPEDLWHLYNLILPQDIVKGVAIRNVQSDNEVRGTKVERIMVILALRVENVFYDPVEAELHIKGRVVNENEHVSLGKYHTLDIGLHKTFTLDKVDGWDSVAQEALQEALNDDKNGALAAVVMQEGIANICFVTPFRTVLKQRIDMPLPGKRTASKELNSATRTFYETVLMSLQRFISFENPRPLLLASPGFVATDFRNYMVTKATNGSEKTDKQLLQLAKSATVVHSSTGHVHALNEVLRSPEVSSLVENLKSATESKVLDQFYELLQREDGRAWYGLSLAERAIAQGAIVRGGTLLLNNALFRSQDLATRKKFVAMVDQVRHAGGEVHVLSSDLESGKRLALLGDVAFILSYPILDLAEDDFGQEETDTIEVERPLEGSII